MQANADSFERSCVLRIRAKLAMVCHCRLPLISCPPPPPLRAAIILRRAAPQGLGSQFPLGIPQDRQALRRPLDLAHLHIHQNGRRQLHSSCHFSTTFKDWQDERKSAVALTTQRALRPCRPGRSHWPRRPLPAVKSNRSQIGTGCIFTLVANMEPRSGQNDSKTESDYTTCGRVQLMHKQRTVETARGAGRYGSDLDTHAN
jgi:hypothetical protein